MKNAHQINKRGGDMESIWKRISNNDNENPNNDNDNPKSWKQNEVTNK